MTTISAHPDDGNTLTAPIAPENGNPRLAAALDYARRGIPVVPLWWPEPDGSCACHKGERCKRPGKHPWWDKLRRLGVENGVKSATSDSEIIKGWFAAEPNINIGLSAEGLLIPDLDGDEGKATWRRLVAEHGHVKLHPISDSGGGGSHHLFRAPPGRAVINDANVLPGLDIRGAGGMIVAPPSRHASGKPYRWREGFTLDDYNPPPAPKWLVELACKPARSPRPPRAERPPSPKPNGRGAAYAEAALKREAGALADTSENGRNARLNAAAFSLGQLADELNENDVRKALMDACKTNRLIADDGIKAFERTFDSGWKAGEASERAGRRPDGRDDAKPPTTMAREKDQAVAGQEAGQGLVREEAPPESDKGTPRKAERGKPLGAKRLAIGSDVEIGVRVLADLKAEFGRVVFADGAFHRWVGTHWAEISEETLHLRVHAYDGFRYPKPDGKDGVVRLGRSRVDSTIAEMRPMVADREFFADAPAGVNCLSGFITFDRDGRPDIKPHSPDHRQRHVIRARWAPRTGAFKLPKLSLLRTLLSGCFKGDKKIKGKIRLLQDVAGVIVTGSATKLLNPKALILKGEKADNGKSQILDMYRALVPAGASTAISPRRFNDERFVVKLVGKLLNAPDELGGEAIAGDEFKKAVTGNEIVGREVYKSTVEFKPIAQHVCATNLLPPFKGGMDRGVRRRLMMVEFHRVIPMKERVEAIGLRVGAEEADLLLAWAVEGARRVLKRRAFAEPECSRLAVNEWAIASDLVLGWLDDPDEVDYGGEGYQDQLNPVKTKDAYAEFKLWAEREVRAERRNIPEINAFTTRVRSAGRKGVGYTRTNEGRYLTGLALKRNRRFEAQNAASEAGFHGRGR